MRKKLLRVSAVSSVSEAQHWARDMVNRESRGSGDSENAMRRLGNRYGISWRVFWTLKYRVPKSICADVWKQVRDAYQNEIARQQRQLQHDLEVTKALYPDAKSVASAAAFLDKIHKR